MFLFSEVSETGEPNQKASTYKLEMKNTLLNITFEEKFTRVN